MMRRLPAVLLLLAAPCLVPSPRAAAADSLSGRVASAVASKQGKALRVSVGVWDARTGEVLHESSGATTRRPASVMKIATTAAAMLTLGPKAEFVTEVFATSEPDDGVVAGDLLVRGTGDPGINNRAAPGTAETILRDMAKAVRAAGVTRVRGNLVLDDTAFTGPMRHPGWEWDDGEWAWFKAPVSSILLTDACVELAVLPGASEGAAAILRSDPATQAVRFIDKVVTAPSSQKKTNVVLGRSDGAGTIAVTGSVPAGSQGYRFEAACVDPAEHFGDVFLRVLKENGVVVDGKPVVVRNPGTSTAGPRIVSADPSDLVKLARHATPVLDVVRVANKHSQNLYAEILLRAVGRASGDDGSFEGGCRAARKALGFDPSDASFVQVDGSGLARENQATPAAIGKILVKMYGSPSGRDFIASLPAAGEADATLRKRLEGAKYEGRVFAKTGTLRDTSSLAGYVRGKGGRTFAFVVLCEGEVGRARELQDDVVEALVVE